MSQLKRYINPKTLKIVYNSHIRTHLNFSSTVWDGSTIHASKLYSLHRHSTMLLFPAKYSSADQKQEALSFLPLKIHLDFKKALFMFLANRATVPSCITSLFSEWNNRTTRNILPKRRIDHNVISLAISGPSVWNTLPMAIKCLSVCSCARICICVCIWICLCLFRPVSLCPSFYHN